MDQPKPFSRWRRQVRYQNFPADGGTTTISKSITTSESPTSFTIGTNTSLPSVTGRHTATIFTSIGDVSKKGNTYQKRIQVSQTFIKIKRVSNEYIYIRVC